jgi:hypothetical protein
MAGVPAQDTGQNAESLIDDAIRAILNDAGDSPEGTGFGKGSMTGFLETTALASSLTGGKTSTVERLLIAEVIGSAMAEALAPALAEQLAPRLMKYLEETLASQGGEGQRRGGGTGSSGGSGSSGRKSGSGSRS